MGITFTLCAKYEAEAWGNWNLCPAAGVMVLFKGALTYGARFPTLTRLVNNHFKRANFGMRSLLLGGSRTEPRTDSRTYLSRGTLNQ